jgi:Tol biopolymer transport system component
MALLIDSRYTLGWMRSGTLARAPLAGGVPRQILQGVQDADWAPDGQGLAVARSTGGRYRLEYPTGKVLYETTAWISGPRFSRDGRRIAFVDHPSLGDDRGRIVVADLAGDIKILTENFSSTAGVAWAPGDTEIWFSAGRTGNVRAIYAVSPDGKQRIVDGAPADLTITDVAADGRVLVARNTARRGIIGKAPGEKVERDLSWLDWSRPAAISADGRWVLFEEQGQGGGPGYSVYIRNTDGSPAMRLASGSASALSPDGQWAATLSIVEPSKIALVPRGAGETRTLDLPGFKLQGATWLPDMRTLLIFGSEKDQQRRLYLLDIEEGAPRPISPEGIGFGNALSPDGRRVATASAAGPPMIVPIDGGEPRPIPATTMADVPSGWSADGGALFVTARGAGGAQVDRIDLASGRRTSWLTLMPADRAGLLDLGFVLLSTDAQAYVYSYRRVLSTLYLAEGLR